MASEESRRYRENGARIRRARESVGLNQEEFAERLAISRRHLIRLEMGYSRPRPDLRDRLVAMTGAEQEIEAAANRPNTSTQREALLIAREAGVSYSVLATLLGVSRQRVHQIINGR